MATNISTIMVGKNDLSLKFYLKGGTLIVKINISIISKIRNTIQVIFNFFKQNLTGKSSRTCNKCYGNKYFKLWSVRSSISMKFL